LPALLTDPLPNAAAPQSTKVALLSTEVALQSTEVALQSTEVALQSTEVALQSTDALLQQAITAHSAGNLTRAEELYRAILAREANHAHCLHNLGILEVQRRRPEAALSSLKAASKLRPELPRYRLTYLDALLRAGHAAEAGQALADARQWGMDEELLAGIDGRLLSLAGAVAQQVWAPDLAGDHYHQVLARLHGTLRPATYLEIGVETGATLALAQCPSLGIDPKFQFRDIETVRRIIAKPSTLLHQMPSDDFFARFDPTTQLGQPLEMAFLDGMHHCEYLLRDFFHTERHCLPNAVIALHDCLPLEAPMAERDPNAVAVDARRQGMWTGDVWRTALLLKRRRPDLRITVLDAAPTGLVLITNLDPHSTLLADNHDQFVAEMMSWSLPQITLAGYFAEMGVEPEQNLRHPEQILARLRPTA
jgi:tetratricopeptide (TPR) repeat protein